jgi:hypothetical protein
VGPEPVGDGTGQAARLVSRGTDADTSCVSGITSHLRAGWPLCPRCGLRRDPDAGECLHCGAPTSEKAGLGADEEVGVFQWRYYRKRGEPQGPMYIQKYETWVEINPFGCHCTSRGAIPAPIMRYLEELPRQAGEAEAARRDHLFKGNAVQRAHETDSWRHKILLALPGLPVYAAYFLAFVWLSGHWPLGDVSSLMLTLLSAVPAAAGGFVAACLWSTSSEGNAWWAGGLLGMVALLPDGLVFRSDGFVWGAIVHAVFGTFILLALVGFALGSLGGLVGQLIADDLQGRRLQGRPLRLEPRHLAAGVGGFGVLLALVGAVVISL